MKSQAFNPYFPSWEYIPGGEPRLFGDRVYVYGSVADDAPDSGVVPVLLRSDPVAQAVQIGGNPLCAKALADVLLKDDTHNSGFGFIQRPFSTFELRV